MRRKPFPRRLDPALALRRHPRHRTAVVVAIAGLCGLAVTTIVRQAEEVRAAWGRATPVLVATRALAPGDRLDVSNTRVDQQPAPLVADGALTAIPSDARVAAAIYAGEVVRQERLAPSGLSAVAARLPADTRAMAIPIEPGTTPPLAIGDRVDIVVALAPEAAGGGPPGFTLATSVLVVEVTDAAVTIAVSADTAPRLAVAFGAGAVTLALTRE